MTEKRLENAMKQAKVSNEIENLEVKNDHTELVKARLNNEITEEEFQEKVKKLVERF
ncbi:hypothetical protein AAGG74_17645 [Bacillus mexicanus]|uniref:hypothetical protein n=1 Tax=Bacillus mexicanus TaxID=2834415 RepID=UPI003D2230BA